MTDVNTALPHPITTGAHPSLNIEGDLTGERAVALDREWVTRRGVAISEVDDHTYGHLMDYLQYALLHEGRFDDAKALVEQVRSDDEESGKAESLRVKLASTSARYLVETGRWDEAATLAETAWSEVFLETPAVLLAVGIGAARRPRFGRRGRARPSLVASDSGDRRERTVSDEEGGGVMTMMITKQCLPRRVFTFMLAREISSRTYPLSGVPDPHHAASHHLGNAKKMALYGRMNAYHMQTFTYFLEKLRSTPDGDGSLLDHSMIMFGTGISNGDRHTRDNLPILLVGGGVGQIKGGRHLQYPEGTPLANLHVTVLDKLGILGAGDTTLHRTADD